MTATVMPVVVYHADILSRFRAPEGGGPVIPVFACTARADRDPFEVCEELFELLNVGHDRDFGMPDPRAVAYREKGYRSLSVGDIVQVGSVCYEVASVGFEIVPPPVGVPATMPGSVPWLPRIARLLRSLIRLPNYLRSHIAVPRSRLGVSPQPRRTGEDLD